MAAVWQRLFGTQHTSHQCGSSLPNVAACALTRPPAPPPTHLAQQAALLGQPTAEAAHARTYGLHARLHHVRAAKPHHAPAAAAAAAAAGGFTAKTPHAAAAAATIAAAPGLAPKPLDATLRHPQGQGRQQSRGGRRQVMQMQWAGQSGENSATNSMPAEPSGLIVASLSSPPHPPSPAPPRSPPARRARRAVRARRACRGSR